MCENNLYGASTRIDKVTRLETLAEHGAGYGIRGETVDGNDVLAVFEAARRAADECRDGHGPVLLELLTYRRTGHSRRDACNYQASEEKNEWFDRDPIEVLGRGLVKRDDVDEQELDSIRTRVAKRFGDAVEAAKKQSMPGTDDLVRDVYA